MAVLAAQRQQDHLASPPEARASDYTSSPIAPKRVASRGRHALASAFEEAKQSFGAASSTSPHTTIMERRGRSNSNSAFAAARSVFERPAVPMRNSSSDPDLEAASSPNADASSDPEDESREEYVVALHDFASSNATCLSFAAGQVIKVFNRDTSGWWDGELDGQRGWFPSNYVDEEGIGFGSPEASDMRLELAGDGERDTSQPYNGRGLGLSVQTQQVNKQRPGVVSAGMPHHPSRSPTPTAQEFLASSASSGILEPILHAIALLHNAVRANRVAHFQPSTACVISSVRSVLSATDCLTRESHVLKSHPILARERKHILSELSKLVTQARKASAPMPREEGRAQEMDDMLSMADAVLRHVRSFLEVAVECGVNVPDRRSSVVGDRNRVSADAPHAGEQRSMLGVDRGEADKTPTPESPRSSAYQTAYTSGQMSPRSTRFLDLRDRAEYPFDDAAAAVMVAKHTGSEPMTQAARIKAQAQARRRSDSLTSEPQEHIDAVRDLLIVVEAVHNSGELQSTLPRQTTILFQTRERLYEATTALVSAARVITSNPSAQAAASAALSDANEDEEKSRLLSAATAVLRTGGECVGAVRLCLNHADSALRFTLPGDGRSTQRHGSGDSSMSADSAEPLTPDEAAGEDALLAAGTVRRGKHTLSFLGRKATSLSCLREKYEQSGYVRGFGHIAEGHSDDDDDFAESEENATARQQYHAPQREVRGEADASPQSTVMPDSDLPRSSLSERRGAPALQQLGPGMRRPMHAPQVVATPALTQYVPSSHPQISSANHGTDPQGGDGSDHSETMSRQHSRASGSTLYSARSDTTGATSARPSMDQNNGADEHANVPLTAPVGGTFREAHNKHLAGVTDSRRGSDSSEVLHLQPTRSRGESLSEPSPLGLSPLTPSVMSTFEAASPIQLKFMSPDYLPSDVCYNSEGQLTGATLPALVEKMTPHDTTVDAALSNAFFLCFRLFTTPMQLFDVLEARYNMRPPQEVEVSAEELVKWTDQKVMPVRLRIFNFFKTWLETYWHSATDHVILERLVEFTRTSMAHSLHRPGQRLADLAQKRIISGPTKKVMAQVSGTATAAGVSNANGIAPTVASKPGALKRMISTDRLRNGSLPPGMVEPSNMYGSAAFTNKKGPMPPQPIMSKALLSALRASPQPPISITEFDPTELARQLTILESKIYCAILPEELLGQEFSKAAGVSSAIHVKNMSSLSTSITGWISECILNEGDARKRTQLVKFFIKLGDRCLALSNFNTLMAIQCALNSSTIARLKRTWDGLTAKYRVMMEEQRRTVEHTRNFAGYRARLRATAAPALPFVGLFLTDLTFCHEGNPATRPSPQDPQKRLLNFDKYVKMSRIIGDLQRFQLPYTLLEVQECQSYLNKVLASVQQAGAGGAEDLYRRSLLLEPRSKTGEPSPATVASRSGGSGADGGKLGLDIFNWK
ncbi:Ras1 guanine nucleotide exchange factor [Ceraceosorus bombacis]|uniref:Ras1 guanine nucleotide exchange factor n=1 Tax=Ceraceosorus bombacis TaxID=401625 RepID=A0A0P1BSJ5_9BASI|nr:Ras1 guanine nucleotide exchange factor [Ceraceosorus bombacis]